VSQRATTESVESVIPEFMSSTPFLIIAAIIAVLLISSIAKGAVRLLIWAAIILAILIFFGVAAESDLLQWFEDLRKRVGYGD
jgi:hypothetical protein